MPLVQWRKRSSVPNLLSVYYPERVLDFVECFVGINWGDRVGFPVVNMKYLEPSRHHWCKSHSVVATDPLSLLLDSSLVFCRGSVHVYSLETLSAGSLE